MWNVTEVSDDIQSNRRALPVESLSWAGQTLETLLDEGHDDVVVLVPSFFRHFADVAPPRLLISLKTAG